MGTVGEVVLTLQGSYALADAQATGKSIKPKYYKVSNKDITLDPTLRDISGVWKQANISGYVPIDKDTIEFIIDIPPEEATSYGKTFGLYLEEGTLFAIAKPPYPFPPYLRQTFKVQIRYTNISQMTDFQYIPFYETEQSLSLLDAFATLSHLIQNLRQDVEDLKRAKRALFQSSRSLNELKERVNQLEANQVALAASLYSLALIVQKNTLEIQRLKGGA